MGSTENAVLDHDRTVFEAVREAVPIPEGVGAVVFKEGEDSNGDPAAWIWVVVKPEPNPSNKRIKVLNAYTTRLRDELLDGGIKSYPFVRITEYKSRVADSRRASRR